MTDFQQFLTGLSADSRLGRYVGPLSGQSPEVIVLSLTIALANACEGNQPHPAHELLERMQAEGRTHEN